MRTYRSFPHPRHVLAYGLPDVTGRLSAGTLARSLVFDRWLLAPPPFTADALPSYPKSVQYQGMQAAGTPDRAVSWQPYSQEHNWFGSTTPGGRHYNGHLFYQPPDEEEWWHITHPGSPVGDFQMIHVSTEFEVPWSTSEQHQLFVALPTPFTGFYHNFSQGGWQGGPNFQPSSAQRTAVPPPGFPLEAQTQSYLCYQLVDSWPFFIAFARCSAGFTAHFTDGDIGAWQSGSASWNIDNVTAFGYSGAVPLTDSLVHHRADCPTEDVYR